MGTSLSERIFRFRSQLGRGAEKFHEAFASGLSCPLLEKVRCRLHDADFSATATTIHWFKDTPSSFASRWAAFLMERGSFNGYLALLMIPSWNGCPNRGLSLFRF